MIAVKQRWPGYDRHIITDGAAAVILNIYDQPQARGVRAYIFSLGTDVLQRQQGHATAVLRCAEDVARQEGLQAVYLEWNRQEAPEWVMRWYERNGYYEVAFGNDLVLMEKGLTEKETDDGR